MDIGLSGSRLGKKVIEIKDLSKRFGSSTVISDFSFLFKPGDRIGIVGNNGTGKSTLLNLIAGRISPDSGEIETGQTVKTGYYTQENEGLDEDMRMIEYIRETADSIALKDGSVITAAQMLEKFLFPMNTHGTLIRKLSGGEKRRLYLLNILMGSPNVLLLDEPTNDLDTQTLTVLEDYLESFPGVVITVSHDRYFLDKTAQQLFIFEGGGRIGTYYGSYSDYLDENQAAGSKKTEEAKPALPAEKPQKKKKKLTYAERLEWETIEESMLETETRLAEIKAQMAGSGSDFEKIRLLMEEEAQLNEELEAKMERWAYLAEKQEEE